MTSIREPGTEDEPREYASPACFLHEVDPDYYGIVSAGSHDNVLRWRKGERERLIARRLTIPAERRADSASRIVANLNRLLPDLAGCVVALYWPIRGEPDLRSWADAAVVRGAICALPVVVEKGAPLMFRSWRSDLPMVRGVWNIPVPADGIQVVPDIVIAPVVGFDPEGYRLGYGGGYYDRTLAAWSRKPRVIGVGDSGAAIATIYPLLHDIPMDAIVTDAPPLMR